MTEKTIPDMKEVFRQAAEIAQQVPESMQVAAFNRALDLLIGTADAVEQSLQPDPGAARRKHKTRQAKTKTKLESPVATLMSVIDTTQHPAVAAATKVLDRALMVLQIALRNHEIDGLTPPEIAQLLTDKFRLNTSRQAVSMAIGSATTLINRVPRGSGYEYRIMGPGEDYLAHLGSEQEPSQRKNFVTIARKKRSTKRSAQIAEPSRSTSPAGHRAPGRSLF